MINIETKRGKFEVYNFKTDFKQAEILLKSVLENERVNVEVVKEKNDIIIKSVFKGYKPLATKRLKDGGFVVKWNVPNGNILIYAIPYNEIGEFIVWAIGDDKKNNFAPIFARIKNQEVGND